MPERHEDRQEMRTSLAFFSEPEPDFIIECIDGSGKYPPIKTKDLLDQGYTAEHNK